MKADQELPFHASSRSKIKQYLTIALYNDLKTLRTPSGYTLDQAITSGIENPDSSIGIYAGDMESYDCFAPVLLPIIDAPAVHGGPRLTWTRNRHSYAHPGYGWQEIYADFLFQAT